MTDYTISLDDVPEFMPIELGETTTKAIKDFSEMREKIADIVARQAGIPWELIVPPDQWESARQDLRLTTQTEWGGLMMSHILPPKEQDE